jgi:putative DNA primase/helicase
MSERLQRIEAMIRLASKDEAIAVLPEDFDKDPYLLNVDNGIIDLRKGILKTHDPADLITKLAPVSLVLKVESQAQKRRARFAERSNDGSD